MATDESPDALVRECLQAIGVTRLSEWDALTFLYRHPVSLGTPAQIAQLIGYDKAEIGGALHTLEALGLIQRSRVSQGIRFYQFSATRDRQSCLLELMSQVQNRRGRLLLLKHLNDPRHKPRPRPRSGLRLA
jgi:DNA-binding MarR family transcriptional regulator